MPYPIHDIIGPLTTTIQEKFRGDKPERAFVRWYAEMRFGKPGNGGCTHHNVDGAGDMGVDYVVETQVGFIVIQSKFSSTTQQLNSCVPAQQLRHFANVVHHLSGASDSEVFHTWLEGCKHNAHRDLYRKIRRGHASNKLVRFLFATTRRCDHSASVPFQVDAGDEIAYLWSLYEEGFTTPFDELTLSVSSWTTHAIPKGRLFTSVCRVGEFLDAMHESKTAGGAPERLFDQNVRTYLGRTPANRRLTQSYKSNPELFFAKHNGIYVVAQQVRMLPGKRRAHLKYPSVINGAQTLWSLYEATSPGDTYDGRVFVRVLETSDRRLRDAIIGATNTQNAMSAAALLAHHDSLPEICRRLDACRVFVERQQKAWHNHFKHSLQDHAAVSIKDLIQWSLASRSAKQLGRLRSAIGTFLSENSASATLSPLVERRMGPESARLTICVAAGLLAKQIPSQIKQTVKGGRAGGLAVRLRNETRIASLLLVHLIANGIGYTERARQRAEHALAERRYRQVPASLLLLTRTLMEAARADAAAEGIELANYFKRDDLLADFLERHYTSSFQRTLKAALNEWLHR